MQETSDPYSAPVASKSPVGSRFGSLGFWFPVAIALLAMLMVPIAYFIGGIGGNTEAYHNVAERQAVRIEAYLEQNPEAYDNLEVEEASNGWVFIIGSVPTQADHDRLVERIEIMFGDELGKKMTSSVLVEQ